VIYNQEYVAGRTSVTAIKEQFPLHLD